MYSNSLVSHHYCRDINVNCSQLTYLEFLFSERSRRGLLGSFRTVRLLLTGVRAEFRILALQLRAARRTKDLALGDGNVTFGPRRARVFNPTSPTERDICDFRGV
jgi:hypothetical protein